MLRQQQPRGGSTSSALQRATALLKGGGGSSSTVGRVGVGGSRQTQPSADTEENDITSYLAGLAKKTSSQSQGRGGGRGGGGGGSGGGSTATVVRDAGYQASELTASSKFLKKKAPSADDQAQQDRSAAERTSKPSIAASRQSDRGGARGLLGNDADDDYESASAAAARESSSIGLGQRFIKKQQQPSGTPAPQPLHAAPSAAPAAALAQPPPRGLSATSPRHTAARKGPDARSVLESSDEGMTTFMEGLTTTSNSARTSEEYGQTKAASPTRRPLTGHRDQNARIEPGSAAATLAHSQPPSAARPALSAAAAGTGGTPASAAVRSLPAARFAKAPSSSEAESISDGDDSDGASVSPRPAAVDSARDSAVSDSTPRVGSRLRVLDMDDLAPADATEPRGRGRSGGADFGAFAAAAGSRARDATASEVDSLPTALPSASGGAMPRSRQAAATDSSSDESLTTEEVASVASSSNDSVRPASRPAAAAPTANSGAAAASGKPPSGGGEAHDERKQPASADSYSEDFDVSEAAQSAPLVSAAEPRGSRASERSDKRSKARPTSPPPSRRRGRSLSPLPSPSSLDGDGGRRKQGQQRRTGRSPTSGSESDHTSASRSFSYGSDTWHTATPSPRRRERRRTSSPSYSSSDASRSYSSRSKRTSDKDRSGRRRRTEPTSRQQPPQAAKADACMQTGLDLEEAILRCHWNSPGLLLGSSQLRLSSAAATVAASDVLSSPMVLLGQETNGVGLSSRPALADLLVRQVALTRDFIETQKRLHQCLLVTLEGSDYQYTTLEETKQYISAHRKPKLTFEEAVRQVKDDMNVQ